MTYYGMLSSAYVQHNLAVYKNHARISESCTHVCVPTHACASVRTMLHKRSRVLRTWHTPSTTYPRSKKVLVAVGCESKVYMDMVSGQSVVVNF